MMTNVTTDWKTPLFTFVIGDTEYEVEATVFVREMPTEIDATVEGWKSEPECLPGNPDYDELDEAVLNEVEERFQ